MSGRRDAAVIPARACALPAPSLGPSRLPPSFCQSLGLSLPLMRFSHGVSGQSGAATLLGGGIWQVFSLGLNHST